MTLTMLWLIWKTGKLWINYQVKLWLRSTPNSCSLISCKLLEGSLPSLKTKTRWLCLFVLIYSPGKITSTRNSCFKFSSSWSQEWHCPTRSSATSCRKSTKLFSLKKAPLISDTKWMARNCSNWDSKNSMWLDPSTWLLKDEPCSSLRLIPTAQVTSSERISGKISWKMCHKLLGLWRTKSSKISILTSENQC